MAYLIKRLPKRFLLLLVIVLMAVVPIGCSSKVQPQPVSQETEKAPDPIQITDISTKADDQEFSVHIAGTRTLTYTSVKQSDPLGVVFYFPDTALGHVDAVQTPDSGLIRWVKSTELATDEKTVRLEIGLKQDSTYSVDKSDGGLIVSFPVTSPAEILTDVASSTHDTVEDVPVMAVSEPVSSPLEPYEASPATSLSNVSAETEQDHAVIYVQADGIIEDYTSFTLLDPPRIVFDLKGLQSPYNTERKINVDTPWIQQVRYYTHPSKIRLVLETNRENLSTYHANSTRTGLAIQVGGDIQTAAKQAPVYLADASGQSTISKNSTTKTSPVGWVNRIDFTSEANGKSTVLIGTTKPAEYTLEKIGEAVLQLRLFHTKLPDYRERPLITTRFESAVDRIMPYRQTNAPNDSFFTIELRESVPYYMEQQGDLLMVHFEASSVSPKPLEERTLPAWQAAMEKVPTPAESKPAVRKTTTEVSQTPVPSETAETSAQMDMKTYTGEKIALDFYETDIKNVFRILREVSGMNFAVDKDVSGEVTLSFDEPVPWDQVLDLILKMNQLGKVMEGNIVRIATLETLKKEESDRQAAMLAAQKSKEQELAMEPLRTEYIPVNYSNAKDEVMPHIENILTEGRGKVDVDERSNLIVLTDTDRIIRQAKTIVERLDRVTPQVMIEARVVEVSDTVSNDLGISWGVGGGPTTRHEIGGTYAWDVAMNFPADSISGIGFQFARVAGTPLLIDAQLNAIEAQSKGQILSAPKVLTLDNKKALIKQGFEVGYFERDDSGGSSTKFKNVDLLLEVTPHVTPDNRVSMQVLITKNEISGTFNGAPLIAANEAETEFLVNDGETIVIGGILKTNETIEALGFPVLKDVPGLKWLFNREKIEEKKNELLIFITPKIVTLAQKPVE